jgi:hypothetical protein
VETAGRLTVRRPLSAALFDRGGPVIAGLVLAGFLRLAGVYWDIAWHIDLTRDTFFSPPHLLIYSGVLLTLTIVVYPVVRAWLQGAPLTLPVGWRLLGLGAATIILAAPFDELWHRLYGVDVTIWSPPHLTGILAGLLALLGLVVFTAEWAGARLSSRPWWLDLLFVHYGGAALAGVTVILAEYEFRARFAGRQIYAAEFHGFDPLLYPAVFGGLGVLTMVAVSRLVTFPGGATAAAVWFTALRLLIWAELAALGRTVPDLPLIVPAGVVLDAVLYFTGGRLFGSLAGGAAAGALLGYFVQPPYGTVSPTSSVLAAAAAAVFGALVGDGLGRSIRSLSGRKVV